ncbi:MAG: hypothetical protein RDU24_03275 [Humidesulfovibrio sp.]|uniref:hypothetical protein n=1 Tax=Humidesulfovibrio sp. TaxID=2910988 RepID=UPI0027ED8ADD|nr:hypothetical protein [Humidesulfovibrio sp.]MDQ7834382.1 hypothetical protein [Humidesulfovibrio sp.]
MFLDSELSQIQADKARLVARCDLRRQLVLLEAHTAWASFRRKLTMASLGLGLGIQASELILSYLNRRRAKGS